MHMQVDSLPVSHVGSPYVIYISKSIYLNCGVQGAKALVVKNLPAMRQTQVQSLSWEDPVEKGMTTHSSILAWQIAWAEEPGGLQSMGSQRVRNNSETNTFTFQGTKEQDKPEGPQNREQKVPGPSRQFVCSPAIKTGRQTSFSVTSPWLSGSWPAVPTATNKLY